MNKIAVPFRARAIKLGEWEVTSSRTLKSYTVQFEGKVQNCTCPEFQYRGWCSHLTYIKQLLNLAGGVDEL